MKHEEEKAAFVAGVVTLGVLGIILVALCVLCKFCLTSKRAQRWSGLNRLLERPGVDNYKEPELNTKTKLVSDESHFMLKMHQGHYVGYDALEKDIHMTRTPSKLAGTEVPNISPVRIIANLDSTFPNSKGASLDQDSIDLTSLKEGPNAEEAVNMRHKPQAIARPRKPIHSFHNSFTIYEERSDELSGAESGVVDGGSESGDSLSSNESENKMDDRASTRDSLVRSSMSCESFSSTLDLLDQHKDPSGLGQVEYSLQYHRDGEQLVLHVVQARNLELPTSANGTKLDCFIKIFSTNCKESEPKKQTKVCRSTSNPIFKENFLFRINLDELSTAFITMQVFSRDQYARQKLVGEIIVMLDILAVTCNYRTWSNVLDYDHQPLSSCAELLLGLHYNKKLEVLQVIVKELRALRLECSPVYQYKELFIVVTLIAGENNPLDKRKTPTQSIMSSSQAVLFERGRLEFRDVSTISMQDLRLMVELRQEFPDKTHETLGYTVLGQGSTDIEYGHWLLTSTGHNQEPMYVWHKAHIRPKRYTQRPRFELRL